MCCLFVAVAASIIVGPPAAASGPLTLSGLIVGVAARLWVAIIAIRRGWRQRAQCRLGVHKGADIERGP